MTPSFSLGQAACSSKEGSRTAKGAPRPPFYRSGKVCDARPQPAKAFKPARFSSSGASPIWKWAGVSMVALSSQVMGAATGEQSGRTDYRSARLTALVRSALSQDIPDVPYARFAEVLGLGIALWKRVKIRWWAPILLVRRGISAAPRPVRKRPSDRLAALAGSRSGAGRENPARGASGVGKESNSAPLADQTALDQACAISPARSAISCFRDAMSIT